MDPGPLPARRRVVRVSQPGGGGGGGGTVRPCAVDARLSNSVYMLEVVLVYVGVQALIMLYCREQQTHEKNKQD